MSVHYTIDSAQRTIFVTGIDDLNRSMLEATFDQVCRDAAFDPAFDTFADFSDVVYLDLDMIDIQKLANHTMGHTMGKGVLKGRFAIITGEDQGRYSLGVYFKALAESIQETQQRIFRTTAEAQSWLGLKPSIA